MFNMFLGKKLHSRPVTTHGGECIRPLRALAGTSTMHRYVTMGRCMSTSKVPLPAGDLDPHLIHGSFDPHESSPTDQFGRCSTHRHKDHAMLFS